MVRNESESVWNDDECKGGGRNHVEKRPTLLGAWPDPPYLPNLVCLFYR